MFRHVVLLRFSQPLDPRDCEDIVESCSAIRHELPGILSLNFVINRSDRAQSYTHAFVADFLDQDAHDNYQRAPAHARLKKKVAGLSNELVVLDYEIQD